MNHVLNLNLKYLQTYMETLKTNFQPSRHLKSFKNSGSALSQYSIFNFCFTSSFSEFIYCCTAVPLNYADSAVQVYRPSILTLIQVIVTLFARFKLCVSHSNLQNNFLY
jgi:hypothetical protein